MNQGWLLPRVVCVLLAGTASFAPYGLPGAEPVSRPLSGATRRNDGLDVFKRSHVPVWCDGPNDYKHYDADVLVQKLDIIDRFDLPRAKDFVAQRHAEGKLVCAEMHPATFYGKMLDYVMTEPGMQAAACLDLDLKPIPVPWMVGHTYHGKTPSFLCSNHPRYRAFLRQQICYYAQAGVDGVMVDDGGGLFFAHNRGGCFCKYCMKGFRQYLASHFTREALAQEGISDVDTFDYRKFVLQRVAGADAYKAAKRRGQIPFSREFTDFLRTSDVELFRSLHGMAASLSGRPIPMGWDNVDFGGNRAQYYPFLSVFYSEINYQNFAVTGRGPDEMLPPAIIMLNKVSDALRKWYTPTPAPRSWESIRGRNLTGLLRQWIAFTYANGGAMRYPRKGWVFSDTAPWYFPPKDEFEPVYDFVRRHRELLDDYEAVEQVGVLFSQSQQGAGGAYYTPLKHVCAGLVDLNIPFGFAVAGDELLARRLVGDETNRFEIMVIPEPVRLVDGQQEIVDRWKAEGRAVGITLDDEVAVHLHDRITPLVSVESHSDVWLFPRMVTARNDAPLVCHLVARKYDPRTNRTVPQQNVHVLLDRRLIGPKGVRRVIYHTIGRGTREIAFDARGSGVHVVVPEVELWGILSIDRGP